MGLVAAASIRSEIARAELTPILRLLEHARHVPALGPLIRGQARFACHRRNAHHFVHRGSTASGTDLSRTSTGSNLFAATAVRPGSGRQRGVCVDESPFMFVRHAFAIEAS